MDALRRSGEAEGKPPAGRQPRRAASHRKRTQSKRSRAWSRV